MPLRLLDWFERERKIFTNPFPILAEIVAELDRIHGKGKYHGSLTPACVTIDKTGCYLVSLKQEQPAGCFEEWLPTQEANSQKLDIFSLGCIFYYVLSDGRHPFGDGAERKTFLNYNLPLLNRNFYVYFTVYEDVISKMLSSDPQNRPSTKEIMKIPLFSENSHGIQNYLIKACKGIGKKSELYDYLEETLLFCDGSVAFPTQEKLTRPEDPECFHHVSSIIDTLLENETEALEWHSRYPKLLLVLWSCETGKFHKKAKAPVSTKGNKVIVDDWHLVVSKNQVEDEEMKKLLLPLRYHGRYIDRYVHVIEIDEKLHQAAEDIEKKTKHPNEAWYSRFWLKIRKTAHKAPKWYLVVDPFYETLETWFYSKQIKLNVREAVWVMSTIASNVTNDFPHDVLTPGHVIAMPNSKDPDKIDEIRIALLPIKTKLHTIEEIYYDTWAHKSKQVAALGEIFSFILEHTHPDTFKRSLTARHLIGNMKKDRSGITLHNLRSHPLLWSDVEYFKFIVETDHFYRNHPYLGLNSIHPEAVKSDAIKRAMNQWGSEPRTFRDVIRFLAHLITHKKHREVDVNKISIEKAHSSDIESVIPEDETLIALDYYRDTLLRIWIKLYRTNKLQNLHQEEQNVEGSASERARYFSKYIEKSPRCEERCHAFETLADENHDDSGILTNEDAFFVPKSAGGFVIDNPSEFISRQEPARIRNFLINYISQYRDADRDYSDNPLQKLKHPPINQRGGNVLHLACHSDEFADLVDDLIDIGLEVNQPDDLKMSPLHFAALTESVLIAQKLMERGAYINAKDEDGRPPLFFAIVNNSLKMASVLLREGIETDFNALHLAITISSFDLVWNLIETNKFCLESLDMDGNSPLFLAVALKRRDIADLLLSHGAVPEKAIHAAVINREPDILELLLALSADPDEKDEAGQTPLHLIASFKKSEPQDVKMAELLLDNRARLDLFDEDNCSALHKAVLNGNEDLVRLFAARGCELNAKCCGVTPLHIASQLNNAKIAKILIENNAQIEILDEEGDTPLEYASWSDAYETCKLLIDSGALISAPRSKSRTALHIACARNSIRVADLLIKLGADIIAKDELGLTPIHYAQIMGNKKIVSMFTDLETKHLAPSDPQFSSCHLDFEQLSELMAQFNYKRVSVVESNGFCYPKLGTFDRKSDYCCEIIDLPKSLLEINSLLGKIEAKEAKKLFSQPTAFSYCLMVPNFVKFTSDEDVSIETTSSDYEFYE